MSRPGVPMSWPALKCLPAPRSTITLTPSSSTARRRPASSAYVICEFCALWKSGRFIVRVAMPSTTSYSTGSAVS